MTEAYRETLVKSTRKKYLCAGCGQTVQQGESCYSVFCIYDGSVCDYRLHTYCRDHLDKCDACKSEDELPDLRECDDWQAERKLRQEVQP